MFNSTGLERKMLRTPFRWSLNLILAVVIFWNAELGKVLGLQELPLAISVVWPATGFSLAAILLFGYRTWPGIFLGNFVYNFLHLHLNSDLLASPFFAATMISIGSLLQALAAGFIIRRFSTVSYFMTVSDIFIFLIPAGLLACMIASTIGVSTLFLMGSLPLEKIPFTWLIFWLGDSLGVYIFTPLLVVWSLHLPEVKIKEYGWEAIGMVLMYVVITVFTFGLNYPLTYLYFPLALWVTYRYRMHGATLAIFIISLTALIPTSMGQGIFATTYAKPLVVLVVFLEVIVGTKLIIGAVINERSMAWYVIRKHNLDLQGTVEMHREEIREMHRVNLAKDKLASLGILTSAIARKIQSPLKQISQNTERTLESRDHLEETFQNQKEKLDSEIANECRKHLDSIYGCLNNIVSLDNQIGKYIEVLEKELAPPLTAPEKIKVKTINLHTLLNTCLNNVLTAQKIDVSDNAYTIIKDFDKAVAMILALPDDLLRAFQNILNNSFESMKMKKRKLGDRYNPKLEIKTSGHQDKVDIIIRDNGDGMKKGKIQEHFHSFMEVENPEDPVDINLAISHDIIVHVHHGQIKVETEKGEYSQITITLPKLKNSSGRLFDKAA